MFVSSTVSSAYRGRSEFQLEDCLFCFNCETVKVLFLSSYSMFVIIGSDKTEITAYLESGLAFSYLIPKSADAFLFFIVVDFV